MEEKKRNKKLTPVTQATLKEKTFWDKFVTEDLGHIKDYVVKDVLVPNVKRSIDEIVTNTIKMILYKGNPPKSSIFAPSKIQYGSYFGNGAPWNSAPNFNPSAKKDSNQSVNDKYKSSVYNYENILIPSKSEAEAVLMQLTELVDTYGKAAVSDLYEIVGITGNYTDGNYGWTNLVTAYSEKVGDGYMLVLPKAKVLQ